MKISTILNVVLALALVFLCAKLAMSGGAVRKALLAMKWCTTTSFRAHLFVHTKTKPWRKTRWKGCSALVWRHLPL